MVNTYLLSIFFSQIVAALPLSEHCNLVSQINDGQIQVPAYSSASCTPGEALPPIDTTQTWSNIQLGTTGPPPVPDQTSVVPQTIDGQPQATGYSAPPTTVYGVVPTDITQTLSSVEPGTIG
ncbi:hypothetical protein LTR04_002506, partial [Oleoguttula sp. CCFEE 6159]